MRRQQALWLAVVFVGLWGCGQSQPTGSNTVQLPANTPLRVKMQQDVDGAKVKTGDRFNASLDQPVMDNGKVVIPVGTTFSGRVTNDQGAPAEGKKGFLTMTLESFSLDGSKYEIHTTPQTFEMAAAPKEDPQQIAKDKSIPQQIRNAATNAFVPKESYISFQLDQPVSVKPANRNGDVSKQS